MTDEKYSYIQDVKDKKITARSARNKRTHNGKGGSVKLPSDYMTKKEIKAMSGEVKSYRLNEPMSWKEFKAMPDDIKVSYISLLRQKWNAPDSYIGKMMGTNVCSFSQEMHRLGIPSTRHSSEKWDKDGFYAWAHGVPTQKEEPVEVEPVEVDTLSDSFKERIHNSVKVLFPMSGTLNYEGTAEDIFSVLNDVVGKGNVRMTISWEAV
jgi:hypothetical protein